ncbi:hypothetical protein FDG66_gp54 [Streptomyces phage phiCAM]|uniref:Uncharacterized protein n=1 Tax=Streptomyces phage phiCAM TaxID=1239386 RepID=K4NX65_9CAUD|nr:hypothetical protein FDG66_gp54 [Streptomyces phage phiCAM]AFV51374.1 hypothetical protein [Streptomyces phage phiCAM]
MSAQLTPEEAILAIGTHLGLTEPTNPTHVLDSVEILITEYKRLRATHAAVIRKATSQHPNTLAAVAASFARRGL